MTDTQSIITTFICPLIPTREFDWCAYRENEVEAGNYGWGSTEREAIKSLLKLEAEND